MANSRFISGIGRTPFEADKPRGILDGLEEALASTITTPSDEDSADIASESLHPSNLEAVSSYNWVYGPGKRLKLIVPGYPSCWNPPELPVKLPSDVGFRMIHQNEYFSPGTPLRPLLRAVYTHRPDYDVKAVDIITDRNSLLKLFKFIRGEIKSEDPFVPVVPRNYGDGMSRGRGRGRTSPDSSGSPVSPRSPVSPSSASSGGSWRDKHPASSGTGLRGRGSRGGVGYDSGRGRGSSMRGQGWSPGHKLYNPCAPLPGMETRIDIDIMGNEDGTGKPCMLLSRWETHSSEVVSHGEFRGWGYQFLDKFTKFGDAGEDAVMDGGELQSHHRVISYDLGGYKFLVRYHGDAVTESLGEFRWWAENNRKIKDASKKVKEGGSARKDSIGQSPGKKADDWLEKEFVEGLSKLTLNRVKTTSAIEAHKNSTPLYPHSSIIGIKTCSVKSSPEMMQRALPQVFFSQTPHLYVGYHARGIFEKIDKIETEPRLREWEEENRGYLKKLLVFLKRIREVVEGMEGRRAAIIFCQDKKDEGIKVYKRRDDTGGPVPSDLVAKWDC